MSESLFPFRPDELRSLAVKINSHGDSDLLMWAADALEGFGEWVEMCRDLGRGALREACDQTVGEDDGLPFGMVHLDDALDIFDRQIDNVLSHPVGLRRVGLRRGTVGTTRRQRCPTCSGGERGGTTIHETGCVNAPKTTSLGEAGDRTPFCAVCVSFHNPQDPHRGLGRVVGAPAEPPTVRWSLWLAGVVLGCAIGFVMGIALLDLTGHLS